MYRRVLSTPFLGQARNTLDFHAKPFDRADPTHWGAPKLVWRIVKVGDKFVVQGCTEDEL